MKKKVSLKDIAAHVGVSTALVSYVLNNKKEGRISKEVTAKIKQAAIDLNYQPNQIARSLKAQKTLTIGLIVADIANPYSSQIARIIEDEAQRHGYTVIFGSSDESGSKTQDLIMLLMNRQVDGFIIAFPERCEEQVNYLKRVGVPFVMIDRYFPEITANCVTIDNYRAAAKAVQHLIDNGRKRIGVVSYATTLHHLNERQRGAVELMNDPSLVGEVRIDHVAEDVTAAVTRFLSQPEPVDAIFFTTNLLTISGLKSLNERKIRIPDEVAVVGFDETDAFDLFYAPVTYVRQPMTELGSEAVKLLLNAIENPDSYESVILDTELIIRQSSVISR
ncbi:LacI family DNA-binding transcriptional regulator [Parabacteroides sp. FAFU027]|uniref:LacI family DNA-binding transcriptional regulator n=1 Tax=Parabacteroides sp. FAFU027 TaxID=2922715 RepID=UPI001FB01004|nr:substrate-binding domain-containing protein [Parabacteroides sp. FAFU027]